MRNVYKILVATVLLWVLAACNTATPKDPTNPTDPKCVSNCPVDPNNPTDPNNPNNPTDPNNPNNPTDPRPVFEPNKMKGTLTGYKGDKVLTVKAMTFDPTTGTFINITEEADTPGNTTGGVRLETDGQFGLRLKELSSNFAPLRAALKTASLNDLTCDDLITSFTRIAEKKFSVVPNLFVYDETNKVVGTIVQLGYDYKSNGVIYPAGVLTARVYSPESNGKVIVQGNCTSGDILRKNKILIGKTVGQVLSDWGIDESYNLGAVVINKFGSGALAYFNLLGVNPDLTVGEAMVALNINRDSDVDNFLANLVSFKVDLGLKKGWNAVIFAAEAKDGKLQLNLQDVTSLDYGWEFIPLEGVEDFLPPMDPPPAPAQ
jgi:hypothetical protein